ncbi:hypothetical protein GQR58_021235 [Nymphon striatum]|nr:hypothetical protein GQR58_021235 [Nymphon striatum]
MNRANPCQHNTKTLNSKVYQIVQIIIKVQISETNSILLQAHQESLVPGGPAPQIIESIFYGETRGSFGKILYVVYWQEICTPARRDAAEGEDRRSVSLRDDKKSPHTSFRRRNERHIDKKNKK